MFVLWLVEKNRVVMAHAHLPFTKLNGIGMSSYEIPLFVSEFYILLQEKRILIERVISFLSRLTIWDYYAT